MILVSGGTGFVGSYLLAELLHSYPGVRAMCRNRQHISRTRKLFEYLGREADFDRIEWVVADVTDIPSLEPAFEDVRYVYHCAALVSFDPSDEERLRKINIEGTANMVNMSLARGVEKFCCVSSIAALGDLRSGETWITEESEWNPEQYHSDYAISKYGAEMEVWRAQQEGLETVIVNPGVILGYWPALTGTMEIIQRVAKGNDWKTEGRTGFVGVTDVVRIMRLLMESPISAERLAVVSENMSFATLMDSISECLGTRKAAKTARPWMTRLLYKADWFWSAITGSKRKFPRSIAESLHAQEAYANDRIVELLQYRFAPVKEVLAATCQAFRSASS